jgi:hypothetical protein
MLGARWCARRSSSARQLVAVVRVLSRSAIGHEEEDHRHGADERDEQREELEQKH